MNNRTYLIIFISIAAFTLLLNAVAAFILPPTIRTSITFDGSEPQRTGTVVYCMLAIAVVAVACAAGAILKGRRVRYIVLSGFLAATNIFVVVYNLCVN
ncbi:MAG: hypothetical protein J5760_06405 [Clostridia bacterium]|nr:hypothetical protein [Clostridia bacterium]